MYMYTGIAINVHVHVPVYMYSDQCTCTYICVSEQTTILASSSPVDHVEGEVRGGLVGHDDGGSPVPLRLCWVEPRGHLILSWHGQLRKGVRVLPHRQPLNLLTLGEGWGRGMGGWGDRGGGRKAVVTSANILESMLKVQTRDPKNIENKFNVSIPIPVEPE